MNLEMHKNIIVTGAAGFVGSNLIKELVKREPDIKILAIDNMSTGEYSNLAGIDPKNLTVVNCDLSDEESVYNTMSMINFSKYTLCYHFAASIGVKEIHDNPARSLKNSMNITNNLIGIFEKNDIKVIYSSTSETYGESEVGGSTEEDNLSILPTRSVRATYAASKLFTEHLLRSYDFDCCIVRFFNVVGSDQKPNYGHVIPNFIKNAKAGEPLIVHDEGESVRSYCYIDDAVNMLCALAFIDVDYDPVYNIGVSANVIESGDLADMIINTLDSDSIIEYKEFKEIYPNGDQIEIRFPVCTLIDDLMHKLCMYKKPLDMQQIIDKIIG